MAAWLGARSGQLPAWYGLSMRVMPPRCLFCGQRADLGRLDLCRECLDALPWSATTPGGSIANRSARETVNASGSFIDDEITIIPLCYAPPVDAALRALKFQGDLAPARVFGALLAAAAACQGDLPDLLVPVPLHADRLHERGFNQAARIARSAGLWLGRPCAPRLLERCRSTPPQTSLDGPARRRNLRGAFALAAPVPRDVRSTPVRHVALVDDVLTTGATMSAAAEALGALAGVERVSRWAVARPVSTSFTPDSTPA